MSSAEELNFEESSSDSSSSDSSSEDELENDVVTTALLSPLPPTPPPALEPSEFRPVSPVYEPHSPEMPPPSSSQEPEEPPAKPPGVEVKRTKKIAKPFSKNSAFKPIKSSNLVASPKTLSPRENRSASPPAPKRIKLSPIAAAAAKRSPIHHPEPEKKRTSPPVRPEKKRCASPIHNPEPEKRRCASPLHHTEPEKKRTSTSPIHHAERTVKLTEPHVAPSRQRGRQLPMVSADDARNRISSIVTKLSQPAVVAQQPSGQKRPAPPQTSGARYVKRFAAETSAAAYEKRPPAQHFENRRPRWGNRFTEYEHNETMAVLALDEFGFTVTESGHSLSWDSDVVNNQRQTVERLHRSMATMRIKYLVCANDETYHRFKNYWSNMGDHHPLKKINFVKFLCKKDLDKCIYCGYENCHRWIAVLSYSQIINSVMDPIKH